MQARKLPTIHEVRNTQMLHDKSAGERALASMGEVQTFAAQHLHETRAGLETSLSQLKLIMDNTFYHDGVRSRATMIYDYLQKELSIFGTQGG